MDRKSLLDLALFEAIEDFNTTGDSGWYLSGGCFTFAYAVGQTLTHFKQGFEYWVMGQGLHYVVKFNGSYWDVNYDSTDVVDKGEDIFTDEGEDRGWRKTTEKDLMSNHNFSCGHALEISNGLIKHIVAPGGRQGCGNHI